MHREDENRNRQGQKASDRSGNKDQADGQGEGRHEPFAADQSGRSIPGQPASEPRPQGPPNKPGQYEDRQTIPPVEETAEPEGQFPAVDGDKGHVS